MKVYALAGFSGMKHVVDAMNSIGYKATLRYLPGEIYFTDLPARGEGVQAGLMGWGADFPAPSNFFEQQLSCASVGSGGNLGHYCDPGLERDMAAAAKLQVKAPDKALSLWARIDREVTDAAPLVPLIVPARADIVSTRLGHDERNIVLGPLFAQAWVR